MSATLIRDDGIIDASDMFCGAGGSSLGASASGVEIALGLNHWKLAIDTHSQNFPKARHHCADVSQSNPRYYPRTAILLASPECTNHSLAKGVRRRRISGQADLFFEEFGPEADESAERSRATMWDVPRFAEVHNYRMVFVENVPDARHWHMYPAWLHAMRCLGYEHQEVFLNSMFVRPVPQSRDRMYVVFWKKGIPAPDLDIQPPSWCWKCEKVVAGRQTWKNPGKPFGKYKQQYLYTCGACKEIVSPYAEAAWTAIDWTIKGERIGDRAKPLAAATLARIRAGIDKYWRQPGIVDVSRGAGKMRPVDDPMFTQTARNVLALYQPFLAEMRGTDPRQIAGSHGSVDEALSAITAGGRHHALIEPLFIKNYGDVSKAGPMSKPVSDPLATITAQDHHALLMSYYSRQDASRPVTEAMGTVTGEPRHALLVKAAGSTYDPGSYKRVKTPAEPLWAQTATAESALVDFPGLALDLAFAYRGHSDRTKPITRPFATMTTAYALGLLVHPGTGGESRVKSTDEALSTQVATTREMLVQHPAVRSFLASYYSGSDILHHVEDAMATLTAQDRHALVEMAREVPEVEDCSFRMLEPHEIGRGMAFPDDYAVLGNKRDRVRQYGNAVTPPAVASLVERGVAAMERTGRHAA